MEEGDIGVCGVAVLLSFLCGIPVNKIPHCGVAVISNPTVCDTVCDVCVLNLRCSVKRNYLRCRDTSSIYTVYMQTMRYERYI